ncbi:pyridoxamine 5'-phosphate oxidase family protein [Altererythrobacter sp. MF3-039]|uniref:pyridoxamine 5'-phosphate oxidase family protein n=1 Tax=Altererythrobacter sp. MF3-039 TaxID=3252901 RepID=UPI00390C405E
MKYAQGNADELKTKFWEALADSPFLFLQRDGQPETAVPMTAQLDEDANSSIWFFTQDKSDFAKLGKVTATFTGEDHEIFARFNGDLAIETNPQIFEKHWNNFVEAWYDEGKDDPDILFLRMDLGDAEIWSGDLGLLNTAKMALGMNIHEEAEKRHVESVDL